MLGILLALAVSCLLAVLLARSTRNPPKFPPGPTRYPLIGNLTNGPSIMSFPRFTAKLREEYGPVVGYHLGPITGVVLLDAVSANEVMVKNADKLHRRPIDPYTDWISMKALSASGEPAGIIWTDGQRWRENRRFGVMKVFGADKMSRLREKMQDEIDIWTNWIDSDLIGNATSTHVKVTSVFSPMTMNVISSICADIRTNPAYGPKVAPEFAQLAADLLTVLSFGSKDSFGVQANRFIAPLRQFEAFGFPAWRSTLTRIHHTFKTLIADREADIKANGLPAAPCILDLLIESRLKDPEFADVETDDIIGLALDVFAGGTDTTSITMSWVLPELTNHPEEKAKLMHEIDTVVGRSRKPMNDDFAKMPYLDAVINETLRRHPPIGQSIQLEATCDFDISGGKYTIPMGAFVTVDIWACHQDTAYWNEPMRWNPQRFIDNPELRRSPSFMPFKLGNRACIGRFLSIYETKIIIVSLLQKFDLQHPMGEGYKLDLTENDRVVLNKPPSQTEVKLIRRE